MITTLTWNLLAEIYFAVAFMSVGFCLGASGGFTWLNSAEVLFWPVVLPAEMIYLLVAGR
jgi:hypothetical protein